MRKEEKLHVAINFPDVLDDATIAKKTGFSLDEVEKLRRNNKAVFLSEDKLKVSRMKT
ncbi:MAG: hypothetical protein LWW98_11475 [Deltaproteobacteria bacterium]|nr:hypothetical protein [Deltaproteobacteria bacterium]